MKHYLLTLITLSFLFAGLSAQTPQAFNYQTVVRDVSGNIVVNQAVSFQISILEDNTGGTVSYSETHSAITNSLGLVNLKIGTGTPVSGTFAGIDWANHEHFMKVEFDITGGTSYILMGTSQLLSVPYALHSGSADTAMNDPDPDPANEIQELSVSGDTIFISKGNFIILPGLAAIPNCKDGILNGYEVYVDCGGLVCAPCPTVQSLLDSGFTPKQILDLAYPLDSLYGKIYQEGLIAYVNSTTGEGFVAAPTDQSSSIAWWNGSYFVTGATAQGIGTGQSNTNIIIAAQGAGTYAATICDGLTIGIYSDWFLPSRNELNQIYANLKVNGLGGFSTGYYWSSSEANHISAWLKNFSSGGWSGSYKGSDYYVRAVRSFYPDLCNDGVQNQDETGIDCGGSICIPCAFLCNDGIANGDETGIDCGGSCVPCASLCSDSTQNGDETGIDCGGSCVPCASLCNDGIHNGDETGADCGGSCFSCTTRCSDGIQNGDETGVDCGGATCISCSARCTDGIQNGDETGIDCGGTACVSCVSLCSDGISNGDETGVDCGGSCVTCVSLCSDGIHNGDETGIDCGGSCVPCASLCNDGIHNGDETGADCGGSCISCTARCSDGVQNGDETGVDCGGTSCVTCLCFDGIQNGDETGVDCGGTSCVSCATLCNDGILNGDETGTDCGGSCISCQVRCSDGILNGDETGVDCGGSCVTCTVLCSDGIQNGDETGIDCGGISCIACVQGRLDGGETAKQIYDSGMPLDSLYGKTYQGGLIFYLNTTTGAGLVAAPTDQNTNAIWGCYLTNIPGGTAIGTGFQNTQNILSGCGVLNISARICVNSTIGIYSDWFLPSLNELDNMYTLLKVRGFGSFANDHYWSSSQANIGSAWIKLFTDGNNFGGHKHNMYRTRAVRAFLPGLCSDGIQNGDETGVDCGGASCVSCATLCSDGTQNGDETGLDCGGTSCVSCAIRCSDGIQNVDETGVDCGGSACVSCATLCSDGMLNGNETGVDCGGTSCVTCATLCSDGIQNGDETGVDCGGTSCVSCTIRCSDGIQNSDETGVDCGGSACVSCATLCSDGIQNGDETGVDCGGISCINCIQLRLNNGETPKQIYDSGIPLNSLYGKTYQGGLIFYLNTTSGTGLVAAPTDQSSGATWGCSGTNLPGANGTTIGSGSLNTQNIVAGCSEPNIAALLCDNLTLGIYSDWFLPSKDELNQMYVNLSANGFGGFANVGYWCSSEIDNLLAWRQDFVTGNQFNTIKTLNYNVRAMRSF